MANDPSSFQLTYVVDDRRMVRVFRQPKVVVGRGVECDLVLPLPFVSRRHAAIERLGEQWVITDLGSRSGTWVNGRSVVSRPLENGDQIVLGAAPPLALAIVFQQRPQSPSAAGQALFDERFQTADISLSIDVEQFARQLVAPPPEGPTGPIAAVGLFQQLSEMVLTEVPLVELLEQAIDLILGGLAAERGCVCLCDETLEPITLCVSRARGGVPAPEMAISRSIAREALAARQAFLVASPAADARFAQADSIQATGVQAAVCAPLYHAGQVQGLIYLDSRRPDRLPGAADLELLAALAGLIAVGVQQSRLRDDVARQHLIRAHLARYSSPQVIERIIASDRFVSGEMLVEQREVSVLFGDMSGFTTLSEGMPPAQVAQLLNDVFERLAQVVFLHGGMLDKFLGDGLMAVFGAPLPQPDHARRAVAAALRMQEQMDRLNADRPGLPSLAMRIGVNSGPVVAGDIGSLARRDYTVIGDTVNVASRLESFVAQPGQVVVGPTTYALLPDDFRCLPLAPVQLKGKQQLLQPYLVERSV